MKLLSRNLMLTAAVLGGLAVLTANDALAGGRKFSFGKSKGGFSIGSGRGSISFGKGGISIRGRRGGISFGGKNDHLNGHDNDHRRVRVIIGKKRNHHHRDKYIYHPPVKKHCAPVYGFGYSGCGHWGFGYCKPHKGFGFVYNCRGDYYNPYCTGPIGGCDYSEAIVPADAPEVSAVGRRAFAAAQQAFLRHDLERASRLIALAAREMKHDPNVHQFHSLVLFAQGDYREAAAVLHSALTIASGWQWTTVSDFYPSARIYTAQLRALEDAVRGGPNVAELRFLLAYHYLMLGHRDAARGQLAHVNSLQPRDRVAGQMLTMVGGEVQEGERGQGEAPLPGGLGALAKAGGGGQPNGGPAENGRPNVPPQQNQQPPQQNQQPPQQNQQPPRQQPRTTPGNPLAGTWTARPTGGVEITFTLNGDNSFNWKIVRNGQTTQFSGRAVIDGQSLKLVRSGTNETLEGTISRNGQNGLRISVEDEKGNNQQMDFTRTS